MLRKVVDAQEAQNRETAQRRAEECLFSYGKVLRGRAAKAAQQQRFGPLPRRARVCLTSRTRSLRDDALAPTPFKRRNSATTRTTAESIARAIRSALALSEAAWRPKGPACRSIARPILVRIAPRAYRSIHHDDITATRALNASLLAASANGCYQDRL